MCSSVLESSFERPIVKKWAVADSRSPVDAVFTCYRCRLYDPRVLMFSACRDNADNPDVIPTKTPPKTFKDEVGPRHL